MPVVATSRKHISELVKGVASFEQQTKINYNYARVNVEVASGTTDVDPIGTLLVWDNTATAFVPYLAQDISAVTGSPLPDGSPICITVGSQEGVGFNKEDVALTTTATVMNVIFRGMAAVSTEGYEVGSITTPNLNEFNSQMETQGVAVVTPAADVVPSYITSA